MFVSRALPPPWNTSVASVWYFEGSDLTHEFERILPTAEMQILVNLQEDAFRWWEGERFENTNLIRGSALSGAYSRPIVIDTIEQQSIAGLRFHPGGAARLGFDAVELRNTQRELSDPRWRSLREELLEAKELGPQHVLRAFERRIAEFEVEQFSFCAHRLIESGLTVREVANELTISVRKLRDDFNRTIGLSPKAYGRVVRFNHVAASIAKQDGEVDWARLALEFGYFDQAHLIHDFRSLSGVTPTKYSPRSEDAWKHTILPKFTI